MMGNAKNYGLGKIESPDISTSLSDPRKIATIAQKLLNGNISVIEAARQISAYHGKFFDLDESNPDVVTFLAIDRETDHRLFAESLQNWARPHALARKDAAVARCEEAHRSNALGAAARLVTRFADEQAA
jgi:hypothetical protein